MYSNIFAYYVNCVLAIQPLPPNFTDKFISYWSDLMTEFKAMPSWKHLITSTKILFH